MSTKIILAQETRAVKVAAFHVAFVDDNQPPDFPVWAEQAGEALRAIVDFRSACHRWAAAGCVDEADLASAYDALDAAGLAGWLDGLIAGGMVR
jgi:hypothetical protein